MKSILKKSMILLIALLAIGFVISCSKAKPAQTGSNATNPLVLSVSTLDGKFSPFFYTSAYDNEVQEKTQLGLLYYNKEGAPEAGMAVPCLAWDYSQDVNADQSLTTYTFILKDKIVFSDGKPVTAKDVLFSIYTLADPFYDGSSTFYTMKIQGINEYRLQTSAEVLKNVESILAAGVGVDGSGKLLPNPVSGISADQVERFWSYVDEGGVKFAQEIVDYVLNNYLSYVGSDYFPGFTADQVKASASLQTAFGMAMWGFGEVVDGSIFEDANGVEYNLDTDTLDASIYWDNIVGAYGYDLSDGGINAEKAGDLTIQDYTKDAYISAEGQIEGGVKSITGITSGKMKCDDGVTREYIQVVIDGVDPKAIFNLGILVAPMHYYTAGFKGKLNEFGVATANREFIEVLKSKNSNPVGAGPYIFKEYKDSVVTFTANDKFLLGAPKIKTLRLKEIALGSELDSALTGEVHFTDPSAQNSIINNISTGDGNYANLAYTLVDNDGYGYIGINAQAVPEFEVRRALAHAMNVQLAVDNYYQELASVNYRTMTKILWAYPDNPTNLFPYDGTGETSKALFLEAGYTYDAAKNIMSYPAGHEKAGQQVTYKFTLPSNASDHPAGSIYIDTQDVLSKIGVKVDIDVDQNLLGKLDTAYESGVVVWAAAWGSGGVDPDMFQIWHSDPKQNQSTSPVAKGLYWMFQNGSDEEKAMLNELNDLIIAGRSTLDVEERKAIYGRALDLSTGLAVEIPTYQRKNLYVYNKKIVKASSLFSGNDVTPFQSPISFIWNVELN
ncbi:MAG TPA: ABC transporter substrate-binding protein [Treponemataceae bacterium]|nr:ABC transporter substrate-binding protein [Treponemataceae bacterium]